MGAPDALQIAFGATVAGLRAPAVMNDPCVLSHLHPRRRPTLQRGPESFLSKNQEKTCRSGAEWRCTPFRSPQGRLVYWTSMPRRKLLVININLGSSEQKKRWRAQRVPVN
jgi:hypothetical protein